MQRLRLLERQCPPFEDVLNETLRRLSTTSLCLEARKCAQSRGTSFIEVLSAICLFAALGGLTVLSVSGLKKDFAGREVCDSVIDELKQVRTKTILLRTSTKLTFSASGFNWDYFSDGDIDGEFNFKSPYGWKTAPPTSLSFDGLGLLPGSVASIAFVIVGPGKESKFSINPNGLISKKDIGKIS